VTLIKRWIKRRPYYVIGSMFYLALLQNRDFVKRWEIKRRSLIID